MKRFKLALELQEDTIITARSATVGGQQTLDYITGASLYGVSAARLYNELSQEQRFLVFHSGKVRFGNALPLDPDNEIAYPMPFAWHVKKGKEHVQQLNEHALDGNNIINPLIHGMPENTQLKQLRDGYITSSGRIVSPRATFRMKTAIDPGTATAAEAQLFGYAGIEAGQRFQAWLEIDEEVTSDLAERIYSSIDGVLRLGRSRSAQYGTVTCHIEEQVALDNPMPDEEDQIVLWLLSDMALRDERGLPTLEPTPSLLGLGRGEIDWEKTFMRFRQYSPYNSARRYYDQERHVIQQGSVITLKLDRQPAEDEISRLHAGIGDYRQIGLGATMINSALLLEAPPCPEFGPKEVKSMLPDEIDHDLIRWVKSQISVTSQRDETREKAKQLREELKQLYLSASNYAAGHEGICLGPGKSQWGRISAIGKQSKNKEELLTKLQALLKYDKENATVQDEVWAIQTGMSKQTSNDTFGTWLLEQFNSDMGNPCDVAAVLARLADDLVREIEARKHSNNMETEI